MLTDSQSMSTLREMERRDSASRMVRSSSLTTKGGSTLIISPRWEDENGCYYDSNGEPAGWFIKCEDDNEHFFDIDGNYVPTDDEGERENELNQWEGAEQRPASKPATKPTSTPLVQKS
jgi:hypothetical protein